MDIGQTLQFGVTENVGSFAVGVEMFGAASLRHDANIARPRVASGTLIVGGSAVPTLASSVRGFPPAALLRRTAKARIADFVGIFVTIIAGH